MRHIRTIMLPLLLLLSMFQITGCWDRRELNELAIAVGLAIDKSGDNYRISVQVVEPNEIAGKKGSNVTPVTLFQSTGRSVFEAARRMTTTSPRKIYFSHLRMMVISETVAREGIRNTLDFLSRDHELRMDYYIAVSRNSNADDTLKILTSIERIPAFKLSSTLESSEKAWAPTTTVTLDELLTTLVSQGRQAVLTGLQVKGDQETGETSANVNMVKSSAQLQYSGLAVFKNDRLIGWLNEDESKGYTYINNEIRSTSDSINCPDGGLITGETIRSNTTVKGELIDDLPHIFIKVRSQINIAEVQCSLDLTNSATISALEDAANTELTDIIERSIKAVQQKYGTDIFGFGEIIRRAYPKAWKTLKKNWDKSFKQAVIHVQAENKIHLLGTVNNSFIEELEHEEESK
ncbi:Ger(x)C family spore germination protein [Paenibacillus sp. strain BS8-2]